MPVPRRRRRRTPRRPHTWHARLSTLASRHIHVTRHGVCSRGRAARHASSRYSVHGSFARVSCLARQRGKRSRPWCYTSFSYPSFPAAPGGPFEEQLHASRARFLTPSRNRHAVLSYYPPGKPTRAVAVGRHTRLCTLRPSVLSVIPSARRNAWPGKAAHRRPAPCWNSQTARRARNRGRSCASRYGRS